MLFEKKVIEQYKKQVFVRCDDNGSVFYFSAKDFKGLHSTPYVFASSTGDKLSGYFYHYDEPVIENRLVVFDHGFGGGHRSYMREIEMLCKRGYLVFAYDHSGCMESGGENSGGMARSLADLDDCLNALKTIEGLKEYRISVMGHSWGAFSTMNIMKYHPDIHSIVAISGFVSVEKLIEANFPGIMKAYRPLILDIEKKANPKYVACNAAETLGAVDVPVLLIYSENDKLCKKDIHYDALYDSLKEKGNVTFILEKDKGHNPNYTVDAVKYKDEEFMPRHKKMLAKHLLDTEAQKTMFKRSFDWRRMTAQDESVWAKIFEHLEK